MISEDKVQDVYNLVGAFCKKYHIYSEDKVQDLTGEVWSKLEKHYDETKGKLSTYVFLCCKHLYLQEKRKKVPEVVSLNEEVSDGIEMIDILESDYLDPLEEIIKEERDEKVAEVYDECSDLLKGYLNGKTQVTLGKEFGISQVQVSRKIKKELKELRKRVIE